MQKKVSKSNVITALLMIFACVIAAATIVITQPKAIALADDAIETELEPTAAYVIGDAEIVNMYGAVAVDGDAAKYGYYTSVYKNGMYEYTYSDHAIGWVKAMQAALADCVKVVIASDWIAPTADGFGTDETAYHTDGSLYIPSGAKAILDLNGRAIDRNNKGYGRVITIGSGATLELIDCDPEKTHKDADGEDKYTYETTVTEQDPETGEPAQVTKTVAVTGGIITGGFVSPRMNVSAPLYYGGGVFVDGAGTFIMNGGAVSCNLGEYVGPSIFGNGVALNSYGRFIMNGGEISGNSNDTISGGGGVYANNYSTFIMNGGKINDNAVKSSGAGVYMAMYATCIMNGGEISCNFTASTSGNGGGVYLSGSGTFTMSGGEISGNTAGGDGGGVYANIFTMSGGEISGNTAGGNGGGVCLYGGTFTMSGGEISGNTTSGNGGGVHLYNNCTLNLSGAPQICDNVNIPKSAPENKFADDLYVYGTSSLYARELNTGAKIGLYNATVMEYSLYNSAMPSEYFYADDEKYTVARNSAGSVILTTAMIETLKICYGGEDAIPEALTSRAVEYVYAKGSAVKYELANESDVSIQITKDGEAFDGNLDDVTDAGEYIVSIVYGATDPNAYDVYNVTIAPIDLTDENVVGLPANGGEYEYSGEAIEIEIGELTYNGETLEYEVEHYNNIYPGTATATVVLKGNYTGKKSVSFKIVGESGAFVAEWQYYIDGEWKSAGEFAFIPGETSRSNQSGNVRAVLTMAGGAIKYAYAEGVDEYNDVDVNETNKSEAHLVFERDGKQEQYLMNAGSYEITLSATQEGGIDITASKATVVVTPFDMDTADESMFDVRLNGSGIVYDGTEKTPNVTIYFDRLLLAGNVDYVVEYANNVEGGIATATVEYIGNYTGEAVELTFEIAKAANAWDGQLNIIRWAYGEFDADKNLLIGSPKYLTNGERVHFAVTSNARAELDEALTDIAVEIVEDDTYGLCYKVTDDAAIAALNGLSAGAYVITAWINDTPSYTAPDSDMSITFNIMKASNVWTETPTIHAWQYGMYADSNIPKAAAKDGAVEIEVLNGSEIVYSNVSNINKLATLGVGEYKLVARVAESDNYYELKSEMTFAVALGYNGWTDGELPTIESWITGEYTEDILPVANALYGTARIVIKDGNDNVVYDSESAVNSLAKLDAGTYYMTASVGATGNYYALEYSRQFRVFEAVGMPWWGVLLLIVGILLAIALVVFILVRLGVFQILSEKMVVSIRAKADSDAVIAAVRAGKLAAAAQTAESAATITEKEEKKTMKKAASLEKKAKTPEEKAAELEAKAKAMRKKAEAMKAKAKVIVMTPEEKKAMKEAEKAAALEKGRVKTPEERAELLEKKAELTEEQAAQLKAKAEVMKSKANEMREKAARKAGKTTDNAQAAEEKPQDEEPQQQTTSEQPTNNENEEE